MGLNRAAAGLAVCLVCLAPILVCADCCAITGADLSGRMVVDGVAGEWQADEDLFGDNPVSGLPEEADDDSPWGRFNDLHQIKLTWDAEYLYVAVEGFIFDNNLMVFLDTLPSPDGVNPGLSSLERVNVWRRQCSFGNGFYPDLFLGTWDGNTNPQLWRYDHPVWLVQVPYGDFPGAATFSRDQAGRALEAAIPWDIVFFGQGTKVYSPALADSVYEMPEGAGELRIVAWITTGADGLGGPDSAPDNLSGHDVDAAVPVVLDNFAIVDLDLDGDRLPDFAAGVKARTTFFSPPPLPVERLSWGTLKTLYGN